MTGAARLPARPSLPDSAARSRGQGGAPGWTNDHDRGSVEGRWAWSTAKRRAGFWDCNPCHAAQPEGVEVVSRCWRPRPPRSGPVVVLAVVALAIVLVVGGFVRQRAT